MDTFCLELTTVREDSTAGDMKGMEVNPGKGQVWRQRDALVLSAWFLSPIAASRRVGPHVSLSAFSDEIQPMMPLRDQVHSILGTLSPYLPLHIQ